MTWYVFTIFSNQFFEFYLLFKFFFFTLLYTFLNDFKKSKTYVEHFRVCLVDNLKLTISVSKQHYTYFYTLFHLHVFSKNTNNVTRTMLPNGS